MRAGPGATARISSSGLHDEGCNHRSYEVIRGPAQARPASALWRRPHLTEWQTLSPSAFAAAHHPSPQHRERERERHGESGTAASHVTEAASPSTAACKCSPRRPLLSPQPRATSPRRPRHPRRHASAHHDALSSPHSREPRHRASSATLSLTERSTQTYQCRVKLLDAHSAI